MSFGGLATVRDRIVVVCKVDIIINFPQSTTTMNLKLCNTSYEVFRVDIVGYEDLFHS